MRERNGEMPREVFDEVCAMLDQAKQVEVFVVGARLPAHVPASIKCCVCGKFLSHAEMAKGGGAIFEFTPSSDRSDEETNWTCKKCASRKE